jgi:2-oxoisovalerate dehydrogenase E1 component
LPGTFHSSAGQEAVAVGVCSCLTPNDLVVSNHRGHGHLMAKGGDVFRLMAELFGRAEGYCGGKGGTQHFAAPEVGFMGSNGITGGGIPVATGLALALKRSGKPGVVVSFLGDGASNQGVFHESLNMAALWHLPVLYVCENNGWAMSTPVAETIAGRSIARRGEAYGILYKGVDGNDLPAVIEQVRAGLIMIQNGESPVLLELRTWRRRGHSRSDDNAYRDKKVEAEWEQRDPLVRFSRHLVEQRQSTPSEISQAEEKVRRRIQECLERCRALPPVRAETALEKVYASPRGSEAEAGDDPSQRPPAEEEYETKSYWQAIQEAMCEAMARDERYFVFGQDVAEYGGAFKVTRGMLARFGKERLINTPISEAAQIGLCIGAAMGGARPIAELMFMDFTLLASDQLLNHAAKFHYIYNGQLTVPLVIRTPMGGYRGYGATHSQSLDALFMHFPGLRVVTPFSPRDAKGLLAACLEGEAPALFIEHKALYGTAGPVPKVPEKIPLGRARIVRPGKDLTICANSYMVSLSLQAAELLAKEKIQAEVIDLRCLAPLDRKTVSESAARTQALVLVEEGHRTGGWGAEVAASVQEQAFGYLEAPILRVAAADTPIPAAPELERAVLPNVEKIVFAAREVLKHRS